jgi:hypothetical protein
LLPAIDFQRLQFADETTDRTSVDHIPIRFFGEAACRSSLRKA